MYDNLGRLDEALTHHKLAYELSCRSGNLSNASMICGNYACNRIDAGDLQDADRSLLQGLQLVGAFDESAPTSARCRSGARCACATSAATPKRRTRPSGRWCRCSAIRSDA